MLPLKIPNLKKNMAIENPSRRQLLRGQFLQSLHSENAKIQGINAIRPPWSVNEADFTDKCTRCGDCILVCETQIIVKGDGGFPEIQFDKGECTFCQKMCFSLRTTDFSFIRRRALGT